MASSPRFFTPTLVVLGLAFAAAPWLFLAFPPWAASIGWAATAAVAVFFYLAERRRWRRDYGEALRRPSTPVSAVPVTATKAFEAPSQPPPPRPSVATVVEGPPPSPPRAPSRELGPPLAVTPSDDQVRFFEAGQLVGRSLVASQEFVQGEVAQILAAFEGLGARTLETKASVGRILEALRDPDSAQSLGAVVIESQTIAGILKDFFVHTDRLHEKTRSFLAANTLELGRIKDMASAIEEFFENIRMISLNLSIEASRVGGSAGGRAFQVLAQKLREFSGRAQELANQQRAVVQGAEATLLNSESDLTQGLRTIEAQILPIEARIDALPTIISGAHTRFDDILGTLDTLATSVQVVLKERLGHLQFQDLTRQEHEHLEALLAGLTPAVVSSPAVLREVRLALAREYNRLATTSNERRVLLEWLDHHGLPRDLVEVKGDDHEAGKVMLF